MRARSSTTASRAAMSRSRSASSHPLLAVAEHAAVKSMTNSVMIPKSGALPWWYAPWNGSRFNTAT